MPICVIAGDVIVGEFARSLAAALDAPAGSDRLRQTEVEHLHGAVGADLDVGGLQIAMDDALLVRGFERLGDLAGDGQGVGKIGDRDPRAMMRGQILALDQLHHERRDAARLLEAVDRGDVRMIQRREHFGFALEPRQPIRVAGHRGRQHLDRDRPLQVAVGRAIHLAHAARADGAAIS